jgi:hypothetical protein
MTTLNTNQDVYIQDNGIGNINYKIGLSGIYSPLTFPCTINNIGAPTNITVFFSNDVTFINLNQYFICGSSNIIFDGNQYTITLDGVIGYPGLIQNGTPSSDGNNYITVQGFIISCINASNISYDGGYMCQLYFSKNATNNIVQNCSTDGNIGGSGGICGRYPAYNSGNLSILNCNTSGVINGTYTGGICGPDAGSSLTGLNNGIVNITHCYSTGIINAPYGGGICGFNASNVNITYCFSSGAIGPSLNYYMGGIVGGYSAWNGGHTIVKNCYSLGFIGSGNNGIVGGFAATGGTLDIIDCYSLGNISSNGSGICGMSSCDTNITNCYSLGTIDGYGITYGMDGSFTSSAVMNITNCYSIGNINANAAGICYGISGGPPSTSQVLNLNNCYTVGIVNPSGNGLVLGPAPPGSFINITNCYSSGTGIWSDTTANTYLTGTPISGSPIVLGIIWNSITSETPYLLATFNDNIYNPSSVTTSTLIGGVYTSPQGLFINSGTSYELINNTDIKITINANNGEITFNLGVDAQTATYSPKVFVSANLGGFYYYGYNFNSFTLNYNKYIPPIPISDICFPENTPIKVDQGIILIQKINPSIHTINNKKIVAITKTISKDNYLVCFEKNSLKINYPTDRTIMSKNHKLLYAGKMIEADYFAKKFDFIKKIKYNGEFLYNVLMESHETISVNNIICETLNPKNIISLLYNNNIDNNCKNKITEIINNRCFKKHREPTKTVTRINKMACNF